MTDREKARERDRKRESERETETETETKRERERERERERARARERASQPATVVRSPTLSLLDHGTPSDNSHGGLAVPWHFSEHTAVMCHKIAFQLCLR